MMEFERWFRVMVDQEASDLFLKAGHQPMMRVNGELVPADAQRLSHEQLLAFAAELIGPERQQLLRTERELNFAFQRNGSGRFRANVLWQQGAMALVIRRIQRVMPSFDELHLPGAVLTKLAAESSGLVLMTGPTGTGKSTATAAILDHINRTTAKHILTLEDPIEFQFAEHQAIINQREVGTDTRSFSEGLRNALRQSPDVLYVSDIRDQETMEACLQAAEAGQLVLSCIHTTNAVTTVERLVAFFPPHQQVLIRLRLSLVLKGIVSLRLLNRADGAGRIPAYEVLVATPTVRECLREGRTDQLPLVMADSAMFGMQTLLQSLYQRCRSGEVTVQEALQYADSPEELQLKLREIRATRDVHP